MKVRLKLEHKGKDAGYVTLDKEDKIFRNGGSKADATEFELTTYKEGTNAHYFKVLGYKKDKYYMDTRFSTSRIEPVKPTFSVDSSSICAWELKNNELAMILSKNDTKKRMSHGKDSKNDALYANISDGYPYDVTFEEV